MEPLDFHGQTVDVKVLDRRGDLVRVDLEVAESPFDVVDQGNHQTIGLVGGSESQPGPARVHDTELPHFLALLLRDQWSNHRLAFVHGPQVFSGATGIVSQRGGFDQQIQHRGNNLSRNGGGLDVDRWQFRVCEEERDMEISDTGVVVWCDAIVKRQRQATFKRLVLGAPLPTLPKKKKKKRERERERERKYLLVSRHDKQGFIRDTLLLEDFNNLRQPAVGKADGVEIVVHVLLVAGPAGTDEFLVLASRDTPRVVGSTGEMGEKQPAVVAFGVVDGLAEIIGQDGVGITVIVDLIALGEVGLGTGTIQELLVDDVVVPHDRGQILLVVVRFRHGLHPLGVPGPSGVVIGGTCIGGVGGIVEGFQHMCQTRLVDGVLVFAVEIGHQRGDATQTADHTLQGIGTRGVGVAGADATVRSRTVLFLLAESSRDVGQTFRGARQVGQALPDGRGYVVLGLVGFQQALPNIAFFPERKDVGARTLQLDDNDVFDVDLAPTQGGLQRLEDVAMEVGDVDGVLGGVVVQWRVGGVGEGKPILKAGQLGVLGQPVPGGWWRQGGLIGEPAIVAFQAGHFHGRTPMVPAVDQGRKRDGPGEEEEGRVWRTHAAKHEDHGGGQQNEQAFEQGDGGFIGRIDLAVAIQQEGILAAIIVILVAVIIAFDAFKRLRIGTTFPAPEAQHPLHRVTEDIENGTGGVEEVVADEPGGDDDEELDDQEAGQAREEGTDGGFIIAHGMGLMPMDFGPRHDIEGDICGGDAGDS